MTDRQRMRALETEAKALTDAVRNALVNIEDALTCKNDKSLDIKGACSRLRTANDKMLAVIWDRTRGLE